MSYQVRLVEPHGTEPVKVPRHAEGGTYKVGGGEDAEMSVTYNYARFYGPPLTALDGTPAKESIPTLFDYVLVNGASRSENYWDATPGNAGYAALIMLKWAWLHPEAVWEITP